MVSCGPESSSSDILIAETEAIAQEYQQHQDLTQARSQLTALDVANHNQWIVYVAESRITEGADPNVVAALIDLTTDMGLASETINRYATEHNLLSGPAAVVEGDSNAPPVAELAVQNEPSADLPVAEIVEAEATSIVLEATEEPPTPEPTPEPTEEPLPAAEALNGINVRGGPGTDYGIVGSLQAGQEVLITAKNAFGDWWQVLLANGQQGWVYGPLVTVRDTEAVAVAQDIPTPPPPPATAIPQPVVVEEPVAEEPPAAPPTDNPHFALVQKRLWGKQENDGCVGKHLVRINVLDANGIRLNGVRLKGIYIGEEIVTGDQGKGDGIIEYDLHGSGEGFMVIRDLDGREVTSDRAEGFTTRSRDIAKDALIQAGYCSDSADCDIFYSSFGCHGHHSWEATFQRNY